MVRVTVSRVMVYSIGLGLGSVLVPVLFVVVHGIKVNTINSGTFYY